MCGIIAVVRRRSTRPVPTAAEVLPLLEPLSGLIDRAVRAGADDPDAMVAALHAAAGPVVTVDGQLRGVPGVRALLADAGLAADLERRCQGATAQLQAVDALLDSQALSWSPTQIEAANAAVVALRDALWSLQCDRLPTARAVADLAGPDPSLSVLEAMTSIQEVLAGIDRLEVRGRDSAGVHVLVTGRGLDLASPTVQALLEPRAADPLFGSRSVRMVDGGALSFVYKAAAEIGELGDNTAAIRQAVRGDDLLHLAVTADGATARVLGHTRWASVGIISQANAHPVNSEEVLGAGPYVVAALNGDIDNFADLKVADGLTFADEITTDAKVIPALVSRRLAAGDPGPEAFRRSVRRFDGSVAIAAVAATDPDQLLLALRGSGQALYVGLAPDSYVVASEPYGLVELTQRYVRLDGETPSNPEAAAASQGQIVALDAAAAGELQGLRRWSYDGTDLPLAEADVAVAEITTRDVDRGPHPHFLLKEMTEAPASFRKTLRGKLGADPQTGELQVSLGLETLSDAVRQRLSTGAIGRVVAIGQGTAAVAAEATAAALSDAVAGTPLRVEAMPATELSGFGLRADMSDTLIVAISQSGTTTDTNRTVDLARSRGAHVVAIVNRRNSDLTDKADGVLYTSDGRDVEMSVASTKAFYSQVAAGFLLATAVAAEVAAGLAAADDGPPAAAQAALLAALRDVPAHLEAVLAQRPSIAEAAHAFAPAKRYWAIVGSGSDRVAAKEIRIKLSELCYKAIACDTTEDKKHIDLSSEPLILVCASGLIGSTVDDVAKEVAIYRAHKATPIVVAPDGEARFGGALAVLTVPRTDPRVAFVLATMVGHLFGYEAALAIDGLALPLREARARIEQLVSAHLAGDELMEALRPAFEGVANRFGDGLRAGVYNGHLEAGPAVRLASLLRYAAGIVPLDAYQVEYGRQGTPTALVEDLNEALTAVIEELTRPIDAIKHQAKTVTVGISRSDEGLLQVPLVKATLAAGAARDRLTYKTLRTLAALDPAVAEVTGYSRYAIDETAAEGPTITLVDRGGLARDIPSRVTTNPALRGTKRRAATEREVTAAVGSDARTVLHVPEVKGSECTGLVLLHVRYADRLPEAVIRGVLEGYRNRYGALRDAVTEFEPTFRDDLLADQSVVDLLTVPVAVLARAWRLSG